MIKLELGDFGGNGRIRRDARMNGQIDSKSAEPVSSAVDMSIREVSDALAIPMPTLRSWELRHGIPPTQHEPGRHRRYTDRDVQAIQLMRDEIARGRRAGAAAASVRALMKEDNLPAQYIARILEAAENLFPTLVRSILSEAARNLTAPYCVDSVILPSIRKISANWELGQCNFSQELLLIEAVRAWLSLEVSMASKPTIIKPVIIACGPGDEHSIGGECLSLLLRLKGFPVRLLGVRVPTATLISAAEATSAAAVVVVSNFSASRRSAVESIRAVATTGTPTFYAGGSFSSIRNRQGVPGIPLNDGIQQACSLIARELTSSYITDSIDSIGADVRRQHH